MRSKRRNLIYAGVILGLAFGVGACTSVTIPETSPAVMAGQVTPYLTAIPSQTATAWPTSALVTAPAQPTPTPFTYVVVEGDTMLGIAVRFGVTLEDLQAANPQVDPRFLSVGTILIIPLDGEVISGLASPTPVSLSHAAPQCYLTAEGGLGCFLLVRNTLPLDVENVTALITLFNGGEAQASLQATAPLNRIPAGGEIPLWVVFPPPVAAGYGVSAQVLTALTISPEDERYLPAVARVEETVFSLGGKQATVMGQITLEEGSAPAGLVWLVAVAYDADGGVVGVRRWESLAGLAAGDSLPFEMNVFSLGPPIERIQVLVEARP